MLPYYHDPRIENRTKFSIVTKQNFPPCRRNTFASTKSSIFNCRCQAKTSSLVAYCCYLLTYLFYLRNLGLHGVACCCYLLTYLFYFCGTLECNNVTTCSTGACSHQAQPSCRIHATLSSLLSLLYPICNLVFNSKSLRTQPILNTLFNKNTNLSYYCRFLN